ncbi:chitin synthase III catalytic subunit [Mrakia frigida]|uniref:chitin synthase III catalytic subunit n=1 Tax=Mrakia frigida TaxID=29902 RepID=UPI003FCC1DBA
MTSYGDFGWICSHVPSFPTCNVFVRQLLHSDSSEGEALVLSTPYSQTLRTASIGVAPLCGVGRIGVDGNLGGIANLIVISVSIPVVLGLLWMIWRRNAAVGRSEFVVLFSIYLLTLPLQLLTNTGILEQGSTALAILTSLLLGTIVAFFGVLLGNAIVSTQVVEDGTMASIVPLSIFGAILFALTAYISIDTSFKISDTLGGISGDVPDLKNVAMFTLTLIVPGAFAVIWFILTIWVVAGRLREIKPALAFTAVFVVCAIGSQLVYWLAGKPLCEASNGKVDGAFLATFLETLGMVGLYFCWTGITEDRWDDNNIDDFE